MKTERESQLDTSVFIPYEPSVNALFEDMEYYPEYGISEIVMGMELLPFPLIVQILVGDRDIPEQILPEGYCYEIIDDAVLKTNTLVEVSIDAHISDTNDFEGGTLLLLENAELTTVNVTNGEKGGFEGMSEKQTIAIRREEAEYASQILRNKIAYLQTTEGNAFPDGGLLFHLNALKNAIKNDLRNRKPDVLILHSDLLDHFDHVATYHATVRALRELANEKDFKKPAVYIREPEFLFSSGKPEQYNTLNTALHKWSSGRRSKNSQQNYQKKPKLDVSDFIVDITSVKQKKIAALIGHETQMKRELNKDTLKDYVTRIPARMLVQGNRLPPPGEKKWAEGFRQLYIHGVTTSENILASYLPRGSMYRLRKIL